MEMSRYSNDVLFKASYDPEVQLSVILLEDQRGRVGVKSYFLSNLHQIHTEWILKGQVGVKFYIFMQCLRNLYRMDLFEKL